MAKKARKFSVEFKREAVRRMAEATTIVGLAEKLGVRRKLLYQWRDQLKAAGIAGLERRKGRPPGSKSAVSNILCKVTVRISASTQCSRGADR
jgi:transposase-like protein